MNLSNQLKMFGALAPVIAIAGCSHAAPLPQSEAPMQLGKSTIDIVVRQNDRQAMFLFAYHAARSLSEDHIEERISLTENDLAALQENSAAFAPLAQAFAPYIHMHPLRDRKLLFMGGHMAGGEIEFPDKQLLAALNTFEPVYMEHFAPRHREVTQSMAEKLRTELAQHGDAMGRAVSTSVEGNWRENDPILLDLVPYVSRAGAYTISYHTVMSALREDYRSHALEMAFHEAAHTSPMTDKIKAVAKAALEKHGVEGRRFWHYLQFHAIGEAARSVLGEDYIPYHVANGLTSRANAAIYYSAIEEVWDQHDTLEKRADAAAALIAQRQS